LFGSWAALSPFAIPLTGMLLHRDHLCKLPVVGLQVLPQLLVKDVQLFVELAPGFHELVESRPSLGIGGAVVRRRLWVGTA
jgi:hypothetical protein